MSVMSELDIDRQERRVPRHLKLQRMCGTYAAAKYLRNRGYTLEQALDMLDLRRPLPWIVTRHATPQNRQVAYCYDGRLPDLLKFQAGTPVILRRSPVIGGAT